MGLESPVRLAASKADLPFHDFIAEKRMIFATYDAGSAAPKNRASPTNHLLNHSVHDESIPIESNCPSVGIDSSRSAGFVRLVDRARTAA